MPTSVKLAFRPKRVSLPITCLVLSRKVDLRERHHEKYKQISASIAAVGVIEPLIVFPGEKGTYRILDGRKRQDVLLRLGASHADCVVALDDECYTYNRRVNYLSPVSEHHMILKALEHNDEERIASALNVDVGTIRAKRDLLNGVCKEASNILKDYRVSSSAFAVLKKMKSIRQIEVAQLMVASNMYSGRFADALLAGTRDEMLVEPAKDRPKGSPAPEQRRRLEQETENLVRDFKIVEESYGTEVLTLSVSCKYLGRVVANVRVRRELEERHPDLLGELESLLSAVESEFVSTTA